MSRGLGCRSGLHRGVGPVRAWLAGLVFCLAGCSSDTEDLRQWMEEQQRVQEPARVASAPGVPAHQVVTYKGDGAGDPFDATRLEPSVRDGLARMEQDQRATLPLLERLPLEAMVMVGTVDRGGERMALLRLEGALQAVRVGQRLGVHGGTIQQISERSVTVSEPVRDALGRGTRRTSLLTLKEAKP